MHGSYKKCTQNFKLMVFCCNSIHFCREHVLRDWRKVQNEKLHDLYCLRNMIRVMKLMTIMWVKHVVHIKEKRRSFSV